jgi:tetratricopeptide (TPR) repeat protein
MKHLALILLSIFLFSCGSNKDNFPEKITKHNRILLNQAFKTGDVQTAISSAQAILLYDTTNYDLYDTLASLYLKIEDYNSTFNVSKTMLSLKPDEKKGIELYSRAASNLNLSQEAINGYTKLYEKEKNLAYLYEIAIQNYNMGNIAVGEQILQSIINDPKSKEDTYKVRLAKNTFQPVKVLAMCYYFVGTLNELKGEKQEAKNFFAEALTIEPEFILAKNKMKQYQ